MTYSFIKYVSHMYINGALEYVHTVNLSKNTLAQQMLQNTRDAKYIDISLHPNFFLVSVNILYLFMHAHFLYLYA